MSYLDWNDAIGRYYFHPGQADRQVTFYIDRRRIEEIGQAHGLGGWDDYLGALKDGIHTVPGRHYLGPANPLLDFQHVLHRWTTRTGAIDGRPFKGLAMPPTLAAIAFLVLAWTESDDPDEQSYYDRLAVFCARCFPGAEQVDRYVMIQVAKALIDSFDLLGAWLAETHGVTHGKLALGKHNQHKFVGAIRYHTLLDPEERALLPALWTEMGVAQGADISADLLVENALVCTWFDNYFPKLYKAILQDAKGQAGLVATIMCAEYQAWDGQEMDYPGLPKGRRHVPRLWIALEEGQPRRVLVESRMNWGRMRDAAGNAYRIRREGSAQLGVLVWDEDGRLVVPDAHWLWGAITLEGEGMVLQRPARQHFWAWPALNLGWPGGGYVEGGRLLGDSAFQVVVQPHIRPVLDNWRLEAAAHRGGQWMTQDPAFAVYRGSFPAYDPFNPTSSRRVSTPEPRLKLVGGLLINEGLYHAELPPRIQVVNTQATVSDAYLEAAEEGQPAAVCYPVDAQQIGIDAEPWGPVGSYNLVAHLDDGQVLRRALRFRLSRPIPAREEVPAIAYDGKGKLRQSAELAPDPVFFHHHLHRGPAQDAGVARYYVQGAANAVPELPGLGLGQLLATVAGEAGRIPVDRFVQLVREVEDLWGCEALAAQEVHDTRRAMESLGFFHYDHTARWLHLAPLRICRLPDDRHSIRALLLGVVPATVVSFLYDWSRRADHGISFRWIWQEKHLVPPILELNTMDFAHLQRLAADLAVRFPLSMLPPVPTALSETLLKWLQPYPRIDVAAYSKLQCMHSFPDSRTHWDTHHGGWKLPDRPAAFPVLTRSTDRYNGSYSCEWWPHPDLGVPVQHASAISLLHHAHGSPHIAVHAQRTDELLIVGAHRQMHLLERALVLASGQLPTRLRARDIPAWAGRLHPDAPVRCFGGIRAPLRAQLCRIFQHSLDLHLSQPIPHVQLNPTHGKPDQL